MSKFVKKLGTDKNYSRPKQTFQEQLTTEEIAKMLQGYAKVDNIAEVPIDTHIRYFALKDGVQVFRTGGFLQNKSNPETYVILRNAHTSWSVQVQGTVFFSKLSHKEELAIIHTLYKKKLAAKSDCITQLQMDLVDRMDQVRALRSRLNLDPSPAKQSRVIPRSARPPSPKQSRPKSARAPPSPKQSRRASPSNIQVILTDAPADRGSGSSTRSSRGHRSKAQVSQRSVHRGSKTSATRPSGHGQKGRR